MDVVTHPASRLSDVVHQRTRLGILSVLIETRRADFGYLRDTLELTDGNLSRHLQVLSEAGLVVIEKVFEGRRPRTWVAATPDGRTAFDEEIDALRSLVRRVGDVGDIEPRPATEGSS